MNKSKIRIFLDITSNTLYTKPMFRSINSLIWCVECRYNNIIEL